MPAPKPKALQPEELPELARRTMREAKFPVLSTVDASGQPRVRPVSPVRVDGFTVYVANLRSYHKTQEIAENPKVELCWLDADHDQVRITGVAEVVTDAAVLQSIWEENPLLRKYLGTPQNPELVIYCIRPAQVRFMREWALEYHDVPLDSPAPNSSTHA